MIALLWMTNPLWEGVIAPAILVTLGYWARPRVERFLDDLDDFDMVAWEARRRPYDWRDEQ